MNFHERTIQRARSPGHDRRGKRRISMETSLQNLDGAGRKFIKQLDWPIGYNTPEQAEKVGLIISKKWIDAGKPEALSLDS